MIIASKAAFSGIWLSDRKNKGTCRILECWTPRNEHYRPWQDLKTRLEQKILTEIGLSGVRVLVKCSEIGKLWIFFGYKGWSCYNQRQSRVPRFPETVTPISANIPCLNVLLLFLFGSTLFISGVLAWSSHVAYKKILVKYSHTSGKPNPTENTFQKPGSHFGESPAVKKNTLISHADENLVL